jgi:DNA-binding LytR/AlgR family response regulator
MRVLLADDEPMAIERLELALAGIPEARLVGAARNGHEAIAMIRDLRPDVAVLDVQMPLTDAFDVIESLRAGDFVPEIIFITAFDRHAVRAFDVQAVDYLLKPVAFDRFHEALRRAQARLDARASETRLLELQRVLAAVRAEERDDTPARELWVPEEGGLAKVAVSAIDRIEAEGDYVRIHVGEASHVLKETITGIQQRLDPATFARVHRSSIVNLTRVRGVRRKLPRGLVLVLNGGGTVPVGPSFADEVMRRMEAHRWRSS